MATGKDLLRGVTVPMVTPMDAPGRPSAASGTDLVAALHAAGADALMLLGSNGEGPLLPTRSVGSFVRETATRWRALGGGPVLVNVTAAGTEEVLERAAAVLPAAPDALVLSPPIYFHHRDDEIIAHYASCADLGIPVIAYNAPRYSNPLTPTAIEALLDMSHVVGLKDSSGDIEWLENVIERARSRRPDFGVSQGAEGALTSGLRAGADGIVPGIANIAPATAVALYRAWHAETTLETGSSARFNEDSACHAPERGPADWQAVVDRLCGIHRIRPGVPTVKEILSRRGLCPHHVAPPLLPCTDAERLALVSYLEPLSEHLIQPPFR